MRAVLLAGLCFAVLVWSPLAAPASARTLTLTDRDMDAMASINEGNPRAGWAGWEVWAGGFQDEPLAATPQAAVLIHWSLDRIPPKQRIINAELSLPASSPYSDRRLYVWRLLADWGMGVCHLYRQVKPTKVPWSRPGARGPGVDRAVEPTRAVKLQAGAGEVRVDVTRDVQLWYSGAAKNCGWVLTGETQDEWIQLAGPFWQGSARWSLRVTYEPP